MTDDEYEQARASVLTSHYTPPVVIRSMYKAIENMGFKQGNILEPSCGIGNFMGLMPENISDSKIYGIEIDSITGRIAQQLYQKNSVAIQGYEDTTLPDSFFDVAIGNVPFGNFKVMEKKYDKHNFLIHDFFFAKTLDKVRPGGIIAFITSSGTMDKQNSKVRKYIAQRADLVGAIRLPNDTFKKNAGTEVTADILFLQKRDRMIDIEPDWVHIGQHETGHPINQYFLDNPNMVLGELVEESGQYGMQLNCKAYEDANLEELLNEAIQNIRAQITEYEIDDISDDNGISIPADPDVKNFSYTIVDGDIYFRENSVMNKVELNATAENRVKGMIEIRDCVRQLIEYQTEDYPDSAIKALQAKLNTLYDNFTKTYGLINSRGNNMAFSSDSSYFLLCSLEELDDDGNLKRKADMFTKRTIGAKKEITHVDTASEALAVSIGEKAKVDMAFMSELTGKTEQELFKDLNGVIFLNPLHEEENEHYFPKYLTADEYLSGNVREKLRIAQEHAKIDNDFNVNVEALTAVQPKDLGASEITIRLGTTWIPVKYIKQFTFELYTMQRYLQYDMLEEQDLQHFDAWASTYGETVTAIELAPEGTGYRAKTRFAKFFNIPELMNMFREVADIQTADMLKLPVPEAEYHNIAVEPTELQREMVAELGKRAEKIRHSNVDPTIDNMLKITNDGRKLALDQRLINDMLPDEDGTKVSACADNVFEIWEKTADFKGTQLVFCDSSTPKKDGIFNVYDDIRSKLITKGVPESDIAFIHDADTDVRKKELFAKVRSGDVRILLGSTQKMGAGTNVQTRLYASHDLDCPWRPSDLEQRAGRIIRQGNENKMVHLYRYVTKDTFDAYSYQLVENKQKFISQIMTSKSPVRSAEDIDETALSYAEIKALATGNPHIKEKMELDTDVARLKLLKSSFMSEIYELEDKVIKFYPQQIQRLTEQIAGAEKDIACVNQYPKIEDKFYPMTIDGTVYAEKDKAGNALIERCKTMTSTDPVIIGEYRGFTMILSFQAFEHKLTLQNTRSYTISLGDDVFGNIQRIDNAIGNIPKLKAECEQKLVETKKQFEIAKAESKKEFPREAELAEKQKRLAELDSLLNMDKKGNDGMVLDMPDEIPQKERSYAMER